MSCVFCKIIAGELPSKTVYESKDVVAFEDISKMAPIHVLVVPKRHMESITDLDSTDTELLAEIHKAVLEVARATGVAETGFRVVTNKGKAAGQSVFHLHFHVLGGRELNVTLA